MQKLRAEVEFSKLSRTCVVCSDIQLRNFLLCKHSDCLTSDAPVCVSHPSVIQPELQEVEGRAASAQVRIPVWAAEGLAVLEL